MEIFAYIILFVCGLILGIATDKFLLTDQFNDWNAGYEAGRRDEKRMWTIN